MKMTKILLTLAILLSVISLQAHAATINQTIASLNADAAKEGGPARVLKSISTSTHVPVATLEKEKAKSGLTYGELYIAHAIANASGKSFDQVAALKSKGQTWDKIAADNNVSMDGKKTTNKVAANSSPSPAPPTKTMAQEQKDRWSRAHEITNAPKPK